jgi:bifunctional non-homologous end joining protein LigD
MPRSRPSASDDARPPDAARAVPGEQLDLPIPTTEAAGRLPDRVAPMQPGEGAAPFDDPAYLFEPWWPGVRAQAWIEGRRLVRLRAAGLADALTAFAELSDELPERLTDDGVLLDGWLLALDEGGWLDGALLRRRLAGDARAGRPAYVATDLLWSNGADLTRRSFEVRRGRLEAVLLDGDRCVVTHALRGEGTLLAEALARFGLGAISARRLDARYRAGPAGDAWLRVPLAPAERSERPRLALIQRLPLPDERAVTG